MTRKLIVIGIGAGNLDFVTVQAIKALQKTQVFFIPTKGNEKRELAQTRLDLLALHVADGTYRMVEYAVPERKKSAAGYVAEIRNWHSEVEALYEGLISKELQDGETGSFLVWGDPSIYDGTIRVLNGLLSKRLDGFEFEVIPGISSIQALAASHKIALNEIGGSVLLSPGNAATAEMVGPSSNLVLMLSTEKALRSLPGDVEIFWGAYVGMPNQILVSGKLADVAGEIVELQNKARKEIGWIMDCAIVKWPGKEPPEA